MAQKEGNSNLVRVAKLLRLSIYVQAVKNLKWPFTYACLS